MMTSSQLAPRMAAFALSVGITFLAGAGLANQTYNPAAENARMTQVAPISSAYALSALTLIDQKSKLLVA